MTAPKLKHGRAAGNSAFPAAVLLLLAAVSPTCAQTLPEASEGSAIEARRVQENGAKHSRFALLAHKPNYLLPATYTSSPNNPAYSSFPDIGGHLENMEAKFQISFKIPLWEGLLGGESGYLCRLHAVSSMAGLQRTDLRALQGNKLRTGSFPGLSNRYKFSRGQTKLLYVRIQPPVERADRAAMVGKNWTDF